MPGSNTEKLGHSGLAKDVSATTRSAAYAGSTADRNAGSTADRNAALRETMKHVLKRKVAKASTTISTPRASLEAVLNSKKDRGDVVFAVSGPGCEVSIKCSGPDKDTDPLPEILLSPSALGVAECQRRATEIHRRGDFEGSVKLWQKALYLAQRSRDALPEMTMIEIEAGRVFAAQMLEDVKAERVNAEPKTKAVVEDLDAIKSVDSPALMTPGMAKQELQSLPTTTEKIFSTRTDQSEPQPSISQHAQSDSKVPVRNGPALGHRRSKHFHKEQNSVVSQDPAAWNQAFFDSLEEDYRDLCNEDGWDKIRQQNNDLLCAEPVNIGSVEAFPADSDYFRVQVDPKRELRPAHVPVSESSIPAHKLKDLELLREVEVKTQEAMKLEKAKMSTKQAPTATAPLRGGCIRTKSDVVHIDSLSDSENEVDENLNEKFRTTCRALEEFEMLKRKKEATLAKYRERWG